MNQITIENKLYQEVTENIKNHHKLVLAFSGGIDSTVLLDILYTIKNQIQFKKYNAIKQEFTLRAIYIHHGLNTNADRWARHCLKECNKKKIPLNIFHIHFNNRQNNYGGMEATARYMRYQKLFNNLYKYETLLTAQHLDDQAETFLLALKRGSGPTGLSGMMEKKTFHTYQLIRPLLQCSKKEIILYANNKKLTWITDDSNLNTRFDRNFLRLNVLPILKNRWPKINHTISRSSKLCAEQELLLNELLQQELKILHHSDQSLLLKPLINMSIQKRQALIRLWLTNFNIEMPSYKKLNYIWKYVVLSKQDAMPFIELNKEYLLSRFQYRLYIVPKTIHTDLDNTIVLWNNIQKKIILPNNLGTLSAIKFSNLKNSLLNNNKLHFKKSISLTSNSWQSNNFKKILTLSLIRSPNEQEKISIQFTYPKKNNIKIIGKTHSKKMKKIWQEHKIPPWMRDKTPLLFYNDKLITAIGIFTTHEGSIAIEKNTLGIFWLQKNTNPMIS